MNSFSGEGPVVFFDGECGLCDRFVQQLVRRDRNRVLRFATLQGDTAASAFGTEPEDRANWSIKLVDRSGQYDKSSAALRAIGAVGGIYRVALAFLVVPPFIRDSVYRWVATHRYRWFGRLESCMLPSPALKERFLP